MKNKKTRPYVLPVLYVMIISAIVISITFLNQSMFNNNEDLNYAVETISSSNEDIPVIKEENEITKPMKPYSGEVNISVNYYSKDDDEETQKTSLIYYNNTYMQNTGILYTAENSFDVVSVLDGTIKSIKDNEILGKVVEISHNNNLTTYYYSLSEVSLKEGDEVKVGTVIGKSGDNKIENKTGSSLLFEVYYNGKTLDPTDFFEMNINDLQ